MGQGFVAAELEQGAFFHASLTILVHLAAKAGPVQGQGFHHFGHGIVDVGRRAKVVGLTAQVEGLVEAQQQACAQPQVARERFQHQLPGARGPRAAYLHRLTRCPRTRAVGHDAVERPVAAANHVARTHGGAGGAFFEKAFKVGMGDDFCTALGGGVGIVAAKVVGFAVAPDQLVVAVALVRGNHDHGLHVGAGAHGLKNIEGSHHVGFKGQGGVFVRLAHQGLRRKMKDHIGPELAHGLDHGLAVADVAANVGLEVRAEVHGVEVRGGGGHAV